MDRLNTLFRNRIGVSQKEVLSFKELDKVLEQMARTIPFENLQIMRRETTDLSQDYLINKMLERNEGGLCYELNTILHFFLIENNFDVSMVRGVVYDQTNQRWSTTGQTHVLILLEHKGQRYLVDTGFGGNLPLKPVPLTGETIASDNGEFRVDQANTEHGNYVFYMKLKHKDEEWRIGYAFDSNDKIKTMEELNDIQTIIKEHPDSSFNKKPIVTRLTETGSITLTESSFTEWREGKVQKETVDNEGFKGKAKEGFGLSL